MPIIVEAVAPSTRKPGNYMSIVTSGARGGSPVVADKLLVIAQMASGGDATALEAVQVFSEGQAQELFGDGSPALLMCKAILEQNAYLAELWVVPLAEDGAAVAAAGSLAIAVSSHTSGTYSAKIGRHVVRVGVSSTDTATEIGDAVAEAINADTQLPFSAANAAGTVTLTAKVKGTHGNDWTFAASFTGTGLTTTVTQPSSGATDPDIQDALDVVVNTQFDLIATEFNDATSVGSLKTHLDTVSGAMEQRPGHGFAGMSPKDTLSTVTTATAVVNSGRVGLPYMRGTRGHPMEIAGKVAAAFTAEADRARPLNGVELKGIPAPDDPADYLSRTEQESCLSNGCMPLEVKAGKVRIVRSISSYVQNDAGSDDDTLLDLQTLRVLDYYRYALRVKFEEELARVKVASEAKTPNTTDPDKMKALAIGVAMDLENGLGYLQNTEDHADRFVFQLDGSVSGRVNASVPAAIVPGLHVVAAEIGLIL